MLEMPFGAFHSFEPFSIPNIPLTIKSGNTDHYRLRELTQQSNPTEDYYVNTNLHTNKSKYNYSSTGLRKLHSSVWSLIIPAACIKA
jgi:hypothetical protein